MTAAGTVRRRVGLALIGLLLGVHVGALQLDEYGVKSAFVYNFLQFIDWPDARLGPGQALVVCVLSDSPITPRLKALDTRQVKGHPLEVVTVASPSEFHRCHAAFVPAGISARGLEFATPEPGSGLLVITEDPRGSAGLAAINLVVVDNRIAFDIDLDFAAAQGLRMSSKLIRLARQIHGQDALGHRAGER